MSQPAWFTVNIWRKVNLLLAFSLTFALRSGKSHRNPDVTHDCSRDGTRCVYGYWYNDGNR